MLDVHQQHVPLCHNVLHLIAFDNGLLLEDLDGVELPRALVSTQVDLWGGRVWMWGGCGCGEGGCGWGDYVRCTMYRVSNSLNTQNPTDGDHLVNVDTVGASV